MNEIKVKVKVMSVI